MTDKYGGQTDNMGVYLNGITLIGIAEVKLPEIVRKEVSIIVAGGLGEIPIGSLGQIEAMETEIKFHSVNESVFKLWGMKGSLLELKAFINEVDGVSHAVDPSGLRASIRGNAKSLDLGTLKPTELMNTGIKISTTYLEIRKNGQSLIKIDKLNSIFDRLGDSLIKSLSSIT